MSEKILAIVLAGGAGTRVGDLYNDDEPVKAMLKLGDSRLIEKSLSVFDDMDIDLSVLSFPDPKYDSLRNLVESCNVHCFDQKAKQRKLPVMLELPYILLWQYHFSKDSRLLKSYDHILTIPCDLILETEDIKNVIKLHLKNYMKNRKKRVTILSRMRQEGEFGNHFLMDGTRILKMRSVRLPIEEGEISTTQAGVYIFSKALLRNPIPFFVDMRLVNAQMQLTENSWVDYGLRENILKERAGK